MQIEIRKNHTLLLTGPVSGRVISGKVKAVGAEIRDFHVPPRKGVGLYAMENSVVKVDSDTIKFRLMKGDSIPPEWYKIVENITKKQKPPRVIMVVGAVDTGKSYLATFLMNTLLSRVSAVAMVDSDIGQSDIGPPTLIGMSVTKKSVLFPVELKLDDAYFVGSITPTAHLLPMVVGTKKMVERALSRADAVVVNTTGMVHGGPARALKRYKAEIIKPDVVVAIQRSTEISHIIAMLDHVTVVPCPSEAIYPRSREDRSQIRSGLYRKYFHAAKTRIINFRKVKIDGGFFRTGTEMSKKELAKYANSLRTRVLYGERFPDGIWLGVTKPVPVFSRTQTMIIRTPETFKGLLVGLHLNSKFLGLGIIKEIDFETGQLKISTPVERFNRIVLGHVILNNEYREVNLLRPGQI